MIVNGTCIFGLSYEQLGMYVDACAYVAIGCKHIACLAVLLASSVG